MKKVAPSRVAPTQAENNKPIDNTNEGVKKQDLHSLFVKDRRVANASSGNTFNVTGIPVRPRLNTSLRIQRCTKGDGHCDCPKCSAEREATNKDNAVVSFPKGEEVHEEEFIHEEIPEDLRDFKANPELAAASTNHHQTNHVEPASHFLVDDSTKNLSEGQLRKSTFLKSLRESITTTIEPILATVGQTTQGCPYLNYWLGSCEGKGASQVEKTVRRYAPAALNARSATEYISIVTQRALHAAQVWARTGKITGVPDGVSFALPGSSGLVGSGCIVQAKEKSGGVQKGDDPISIQQKLGDGQPLTSSVRSRMESAFGMSFSHVRTHTDSNASSVSSQVNARAFTVGHHVAFNNGEYQPGTPMGDALIAHELAHTIQQHGANETVALDQHDDSYRALEHDADLAATSVIENLYSDSKSVRSGISSLRTGLAVQRCCSTKPTPLPVTKSVTIDMVKLRGSSRNPSEDLARANGIYNTCNVGFTIGQNVTATDADSDSWLGGDTDLHANNNCGNPSAEERALFDGAKTKFGLASRMKFFFVDTISGIDALGYSFPPMCGPSAAHVNHAVIPNNALCDTVAHELGHILLNSATHASIDNPADTTNIMYSPRNGSEIDRTQCTQIRANI